MKLQDISKPQTLKVVNENLAKTFGQRINTDEFTLEQLYDARNRIRTTLRNIETMESFDSTNNDNYQRNKMLHDVLNTAISERMDTEDELVGEDEEVVDEASTTGQQLISALKQTLAKNGINFDQLSHQAKKDAMSFINGALAGGAEVGSGLRKTISKGVNTVKKAVTQPSSVRQRTTMQTDSIKYTKGSKLREGAQEQAELVMASKELADTVGKWLQDTAEMQSESMLKLTDAIRDELGQEQADSFQNAVKPTLEALYQALEASRTALTQGVSLLTGEGAPADAMGGEEMPAEGGDEMAAEPGMEPIEGGEEMGAEMGAEMGDEFAGAEAAGGGTAPEGREQRESRIPLSHQLGTILSSKKK
jgi:hypothetical protein